MTTGGVGRYGAWRGRGSEAIPLLEVQRAWRGEGRGDDGSETKAEGRWDGGLASEAAVFTANFLGHISSDDLRPGWERFQKFLFSSRNKWIREYFVFSADRKKVTITPPNYNCLLIMAPSKRFILR